MEDCNGRDDNCNGLIDEQEGGGTAEEGKSMAGDGGPMPDNYSSVCGEGNTIYTYNGGAYLYFWGDAYYYNLCPYGYTTVVINDAAENSFVYEKAMYEYGGESAYWLGLMFDWDSNKYYWTLPFEQPTYRDWAPGQPQNGDGQDCVYVQVMDETPSWYATSCGNYANFICEACGADTDGDGYGDRCDCAPTDPDIYPGAMEIEDNGIDDNCNGEIDEVMQQPDFDAVPDSDIQLP
jgi:hypothetical protein